MVDYVRDRIRKRQEERYYTKYPDKKDRAGAKPEPVPEAPVQQSNDPQIAAALVTMQKDLERQRKLDRRERQKQAVKDLGNDVKRLVPRGIKLPDSMVRNKHLYMRAPKRRIRLF